MSTTNSIVDYLTSKGQDSSLSARAKLAVDNGLIGSTQEYLSLASQGLNGDINSKLLSKLSSSSSTTTPTTTPASGTSYAGNAPVVTGGAITSSDLTKSYNLPEPTKFIDGTKLSSLNEIIGNVAKVNMTNSTQYSIDQLRAQLQETTTRQKEQAQKEVDAYKKQINDIVGSTDTVDAYNAAVKKYKIEDNLELYTEIQQKIVDAQQALEIGLIYEKDRPARMKFITGAESTLKQQGLATIGALQGTAAVIKGNIDIAKGLVESTVAAINTDNERSFKALTTLLDLANNELISLTDEERKLVDDRITSIEAAATDLQNKKEAAIDLMVKFPRAYLQGGVTLLDSYEEALQKMLPVMAQDETDKLNAELTSKSSSTKLTDAQISELKAELLDLKSKGMTYDEAIIAYSNDLPISYINDVYGRKSVSDPEQIVTDSYYKQFINPDGTMKTGYTVTVDPKNGRPVVSESESPGFWSQIGSAFSSIFS